MIVSEDRVTFRTTYLDGCPVRLMEPFDFRWLRDLGKVFAVRDEQDSGNLGIGLQTVHGKRFLKLAGVRTIHSQVEPKAAIRNLARAAHLYRELTSPLLPVFRGEIAREVSFSLLFDWVEGENLYRGKQPASGSDGNGYERFRKLPLATRKQILLKLMNFMEMVSQEGLIAVDLYDGNFVYDFTTGKFYLFDLDEFCAGPFINPGRLSGSTRFMAPEEMTAGAVIDERVNVSRLGALMFFLLGDERTRTRADWQADERLFEIALKATARKPEERYTCVKEMIYEIWSAF